jgi:hypothetical protein
MDRSPPAHGPSPSTLTAPPAPERPAAAVRHLISLTRLPARRRTRRLRVAPFVSLSLSLSPPFPPLSLCPLVARRRWCREPCAGAGGGRGAAGGGAGRSAASGGRRAASRVVLATGASPATKIRQGVCLPIPLPSHPAAVVGCICVRI